MRITNSILQRTTLAGVQQNIREIQRAADRVSSGTRVGAASDDPGVAGTVLRTDSQIRALTQYRSNIGAARTRLGLEETILDQLTDLLTRARELALREGGGISNLTTMQISKEEADQLLETAIQLGNTEFEGLYLFGGDHADRRPIELDGTMSSERPPTGETQVEVSAGQRVHANHDASQIFGRGGVIGALRALVDALDPDSIDPADLEPHDPDDPDAVSNATAKAMRNAIREAGELAGTAVDEVQMLVGELGARVIRLDIAESNIEALDVNLRTFRSDLTDAEFEEAMTELVGRQTALQAALVATSRILQTTLTDYLR